MGNFRLRIDYVKQGRLRFLSHLQTTGAVERAIRRAALPYAITQGFHPHMKAAFGSALAVGCASDHEYFDVWLTEFLEPEVVLGRLQSFSVDDLQVTDVWYVSDKAPASTVEFTLSQYQATCEIVHELGEKEIEEKLSEFFEKNLTSTTIEIQTKKKLKTYDLSQSIWQAPMISDFAHEEQGDGQVTTVFDISLGIRALERGTMRPDAYLAYASDLFEATYGSPITVRYLCRKAQLKEG